MKNNFIYLTFIPLIFCIWHTQGQGSDPGNNPATLEKAYELAHNGSTAAANQMLRTLADAQPENQKVEELLASTSSWEGNYAVARGHFNKLLSENKSIRRLWIAAVKNELYAKNYSTALGLSNKALLFIKGDKELARLRTMALQGISDHIYITAAWDTLASTDGTATRFENVGKAGAKGEVVDSLDIDDANHSERISNTIEGRKNVVAVNNSVTVFDQRYDPMTFTSLSYQHKTPYGSIIPRINYSNRLGINGLQYDIDLYPKIMKGVYAYINYGFSNSEIYPKHKVGGDVYYNHKSGIEFSGGGRFINFPTRDVKVVTNSIGYYTGNYYFSLRSYVTPVPDGLTRASGNLLVRRYLKDAHNYIGLNGGFGFSPELRQFTAGDQILAETLLYIESQRLSCEYQFTSRNNLNAYRTTIGIMRQELIFAPGSFFWSFSAGLTYEINF